MAVTAQWLFYNYKMIENYTFLRNESQHLKFLYFRQVVVSAKCLFGEKSVRHAVRSTKCSFDKVSVGKMSVGKMYFGKMSFAKVSFGNMSGYRNYLTISSSKQLQPPLHHRDYSILPNPFLSLLSQLKCRAIFPYAYAHARKTLNSSK